MDLKIEADRAAAEGVAEMQDARSMALFLMSEALARLDSDSNIPPVVGAQLQSAIDALWTSGAAGHHSIRLH